MKVYSAALILPDGRAYNVRYLLEPEELAGLQGVGLIPHHAYEVAGMQETADCILAELEKEFHTALGGAIQ